MALFSTADVIDWLDLDPDLAIKIDTAINRSYATEEARRLVGGDAYDDIEASQTAGDKDYDRVAQAEVLLAFASYIGNRGGIRVSAKGGLVRDLGIVNQQQTIRQLLTQGQVEQVQGRLEQQAEQVLGDLVTSDSFVWGV